MFELSSRGAGFCTDFSNGIVRRKNSNLTFFDGFRTSHEVAKIDELSYEEIKNLVDDKKIAEHRSRSLNPDNPTIRGTAQNPDVYFQARETTNLFVQ